MTSVWGSRTLLAAAWVLVVTEVRPAPAKIAVREFHNDVRLKGEQTAYVTDLVREQALELGTEHYFVMTRENILEMLPPGLNCRRR